MPHALPLVQGGTSYIAHLLNPRLSPVPPVTCTPLDTHFEGTGGTGGVQGAQGATGGVQKRVQGVHGVQPERSRVQACTPLLGLYGSNHGPFHFGCCSTVYNVPLHAWP